MTAISVVSVQLVRDRTVRYEGADRVCNNPQAVADVFAALHGGEPDRETVVAIMLDTRNRPTAIHTVGTGTLNSSLVHPREVFKAAILANAASIVLAHNHPSGDESPSPEDLAVTKRLIKAGELVGIELVDHVIVARGRAYSMRYAGLIGNSREVD